MIFPFLVVIALIILRYSSRWIMRMIKKVQWGLDFAKCIASSYKYPVNASEKRHGGDLVAQTLKGHGVDHLFTLSGGHISPILVGAEKIGIKVIDTRHEVNAVFAADAVSRLSGKLGVACVTAGPGVTNTITAAKNAQMAQSPLLIIGGAAGTLLKGQGALQDIDQLSLFSSICKECFVINRVRNIVPTLKDAIQLANSPTPGPVFVEIPLDILYSYPDCLSFFVPQKKGKSNNDKDWFTWALERYCQGLHGGAFQNWDYSPLDIKPLEPEHNSIVEASSFIREAKNPLFIVGSQAVQGGIPVSMVREALESIRVPVSLSGMARGLLGKDSDIHVRQNRRDAIKEADLIILVGSCVDFRLNYGRDFRKNQKVIVVNLDEVQLNLNHGLTYNAFQRYQGEPGIFLNYLASELKKWFHKTDKEWISKLRARTLAKEAANLEKSKIAPEQHLNPIKVFQEMDKVLDDNSIIVADGGDFVATAAYTLKPRGPLSWLDPGPFGTLGVGGGFSLAAKLVCPESEVWLIWGDGSSGYSLMEFDSFKRHGTPVIAVIGNDACWSQIARDQVTLLGLPTACNLDYSNYDKVAEAFGAVGYVVTKDKEDQLGEIFLKAKEHVRNGQSVIINIMIGKSDFRAGSISV